MRELDISGSHVEDMWREDSLSVERLDVRGTPMVDVWFLKRMVQLKELIVIPDQFSPEVLSPLPERVQVIERPYP